ncbi:hypothetical protein PF010_g827 [Phytophthora fragariae]|uniref:STIL N-terminal domain-containing protein n=1 Tax=Phytophthora fragariae TaxID=53985 RepID=A0A6G0M3C9_9STRA|nr:hypothetical protein PF010_g827 [Phytophthora fragariae]
MRRHFAQFDDELQDSDQTIARHLQPRARLPTLADASDRSSSNGRAHPARRRFPASAFFSDTTDDDMSRPIARPSGRSQLSMSACSRSNQQTTSRAPLHMSAGPSGGRCRSERAAPTLRVHVDAIQFPATRSVLWDRRQLSAEPIGVSFGQVLPQFIVSAEALKEIYRLYGENSGARGNGVALCYLFGDAKTPRVKKVLLEGVKMTKEDARAAGAWCIPVHRVAGGNDPGVSQESYAATIAAVQSSYRDEYTDNVASKLQPKLLVFRSSPHEAQLDFQLECAASPVLFKFSLVRNLPLLMTPLAASLARREFSTRSGNLRSGYLTLDRTRKAVPLLKVDPLVLQQPVVGVWVYGVQIDDAWDEETVRRQLADPFLYFACIGYLMSEAIKERVGPARNTFLVAMHENGHRNSQSSIVSVPRQMGDDSFSDKPSIHAHQQNENEENNEDMDKDKDVSLSSLDLSSISSGSVDANLSSLSSSLAGERLKELDSSSSISKLQARDDFAGLQAEALQRSKISTGSTRSAFQRENYADAEATVDQGRGKIEENTAAQNLAISELSSSMNGEAARDGHKSSVVSAGSHEDDEDRDADVSGNNRSVFERLLPPDVYLRKVGGFVDHHGGCFTTPPLDFHSFCVPRIKFSSEAPECSLSDSEDEEIRLIEQKYKRLMAA